MAEAPGPENDYGRAEIGGMDGPIRWESLLEGDGLEGWDIKAEDPIWSRDNDAVVVSSGDSSNHAVPALRGDVSWKSFELKTQITVVRAPAVQIGFRITDAGRYVFQFLNGWKCACLCIVDDNGLTKLDVVDFVVEPGREYDLVISAREKSLVTYIDGTLVNRLTDDTYSKGGISLGVWGKNSDVRFRDPKVRHYS